MNTTHANNMMKNKPVKFVLDAALSALVLVVGAWPGNCLAARAPGPVPAVPDLTHDGKPDAKRDWTLGPTGARGWIWGWTGQSTDARQILITEVDKGSPCDGILQKGDVLVGVNGKPFDADARIQFARAITEAEKDKGILKLVRWRDGHTTDVELKLAVLGSYSATAPYNDPKSKRILELGCAAIAKEGLRDQKGDFDVTIQHDMNALALLASGIETYRPLVVEYAHKIAGFTPDPDLGSWFYGYDVLFLAEYALATKDPAVLSGLRRLSLDIANGQSGVGTWGHRLANPGGGNLNGYGCMNQPGIVLTLALAVAREAGVKEPAVDAAIKKSVRFLRWYVNKGSIPYGDHLPWRWHDDNGKNASAAILFDLLGDKEAATFFSRMATAAYNERESGHTGNFFGHLWALPGVSRSGPLATGAYIKEQDWFYDLARCWDGRFVYQPTPGDWENYAYEHWDSTGAYLLSYALPLKLTIVTGRKPSVVSPLSAPAVANTIAAGRDFSYWTENTAYDDRSDDALFDGLASWSPAVRMRSASAMGRRDGNFVPRLIKMLGSSKADDRYGACEALGDLGPKADVAAAKVRALLVDPDPWVRFLAANALARMGQKERMASVSALMKAMGNNDPADPRERVDEAMAEALFAPRHDGGGPAAILQNSLDGVDRPMLYAAIRDVLKNQDARIRSLLVSTYKLLSAQDVAILLPDIVAAIKKPAPSGEMYGYYIRMAGVELLAKWHIREGMPLCVEIMSECQWGRHLVMDRCVKVLEQYGSAAREVLPNLRQADQTIANAQNWAAENKAKDRLTVKDTIAMIEANKTAVTVISAKDFIAHPPEKP